MASLADYLRETGAVAFAWGDCDCCSWVCDWIALRRGVDPAAGWRGRYRSQRGALRHLAAGGGMEMTVQEAFAAAGLSWTAEPRPGDVGLVRTDQGLSLAIRTARGWACKAERGVVVAPFDCVASWSL